jgi:hypothetical protein
MPDYRINLSVEGKHYAKIVLPIGTTETEAINKLCFFRNNLPGLMQVTMTRWTSYGEDVQS